ncbi:MAG: hypothetical protein Q8865_06555 [Bacillota bacterium]|nr:hypothetical protein [Bacillota bacterium]
MKIILAKTAGFCFGVKRAIGAVEDMLDKGEKRIYTLGPIIHNEEMVNNLAARGVQVVDSPDRAEDGTLLVIRTHGVPRSVLDYIKEKGISYQDETCPLVSKIHKIVEKASSDGNTVFIIGTPEHPEVVGIRGYAGKDSFIFENAEQLECFTDKNPQFANKSVLMAAQTTLNLSEWKKCCDYFKKKLYKWHDF